MPLQLKTSKVVHKSKLFIVRKVELEHENGKKEEREDVIRNSAVTIFPLTKENEIYYIYQYRYFFNSKIYEAVAGFIEEGEAPIDAAKRELKEETGITAKRWTAMSVVEMAASVVKITQHIFLAQDLEMGEQDLDDGEEIHVVKLPLQKALKMIDSNEMKTAGTMFGTLYVDRMIREGKITV